MLVIYVKLLNFSSRVISIISLERFYPSSIAKTKFNVGLKSLLHQSLLEPECQGDLVYKFKIIMGRTDFSDQFKNNMSKTFWL